MNPHQRIVVLGGALVLALACLFPPWRAESVAEQAGRPVPVLTGPSDRRTYRLAYVDAELSES